MQNQQPHSENTSCDGRNSSGCLIHKFQRYGYCRLIFVTLVDNKLGNGIPTVIFFSLSCQLYSISIRSMLRNRMALWWCNYGGSRNRHSRNLRSQDLRFAARDEAVLPRRQAIRTLSQFSILVYLKDAFHQASVGSLFTHKYTVHGTGVPAGGLLVPTHCL